jgi:hypothetical protein
MPQLDLIQPMKTTVLGCCTPGWPRVFVVKLLNMTRLHSIPANAGRRHAGDWAFSRTAVLPHGAGDTNVNAMPKIVIGGQIQMDAFGMANNSQGVGFLQQIYFKAQFS